MCWYSSAWRRAVWVLPSEISNPLGRYSSLKYYGRTGYPVSSHIPDIRLLKKCKLLSDIFAVTYGCTLFIIRVSGYPVPCTWLKFWRKQIYSVPNSNCVSLQNWYTSFMCKLVQILDFYLLTNKKISHILRGIFPRFW